MTTTTSDASNRAHRAAQPGGAAPSSTEVPLPHVAAPPIVRTAAEGPHGYERASTLFAAARTNMQALRDLMRADMDIDAGDTQGNTALLLAAQFGDLQAVIYLKRNGAWIDCRNLAGETPLLLAARYGHLSLVKKLLKTWGANASSADKRGWTPLHHAASAGHADIVRMLIAAGGNLDPVLSDGCTPFLKAVAGSHCETTRILLQAGCNLQANDAFVDWLAVSVGDLGMFDVLSQYGRWKEGLIVRHGGSSALCGSAALSGNTPVLHWLIKAGLPFTPSPDMLFNAVEKGDNDMVRLLLDSGLPPDSVDAKGSTALWKAVERANIPTVDSLLGKGADMLSESHPELLLLRAIRTGDAALVARLLQGGRWKTLILPPMLLAAELGHANIVGCLLDAGFAYETADCAKSAAFLASEHGHVGVVRLLHERNAGGDHDHRRDQILCAIKKQHAPIVALLLEKGSKVDAELEQVAMSCMSMAKPPSLAIVDLLVSAKHPIQPTNPAGLNANCNIAHKFQEFSLAVLEAAALSDAAAREPMRLLGIRSANWSALLMAARTVLNIGPELTVEGASKQWQQGAALGLLLAAMPAYEDAHEGRDEFHLFDNARSQKQALGLAGKAHFDAICSGAIDDLAAFTLAHSNTRLQTNGIEKALNERGALLPSLAHQVAGCCNAAILTAFATLNYQGPVAGLAAYLQTRLPVFLAASLLRWLDEAASSAPVGSLAWTADALSPEAALAHMRNAQLNLLRRQAEAWARLPSD